MSSLWSAKSSPNVLDRRFFYKDKISSSDNIFLAYTYYFYLCLKSITPKHPPLDLLLPLTNVMSSLWVPSAWCMHDTWCMHSLPRCMNLVTIATFYDRISLLFLILHSHTYTLPLVFCWPLYKVYIICQSFVTKWLINATASTWCGNEVSTFSLLLRMRHNMLFWCFLFFLHFMAQKQSKNMS